MTTNETKSLSEYIDEAIQKTPVSPYNAYAITLLKTNIFLRQQLKKLETTCKDCGYSLHKEDKREKLDNGDVLCKECANNASAEAWTDWQMMEDAQRS